MYSTWKPCLLLLLLFAARPPPWPVRLFECSLLVLPPGQNGNSRAIQWASSMGTHSLPLSRYEQRGVRTYNTLYRLIILKSQPHIRGYSST